MTALDPAALEAAIHWVICGNAPHREPHWLVTALLGTRLPPVCRRAASIARAYEADSIARAYEDDDVATDAKSVLGGRRP